MKVGFEIHIQINSPRKLFCSCNPKEKDTKVYEFKRRLRVSSSELGEVDPAAAFELKKGLEIIYEAGDRTSCLVEADEEPPHDPDPYSIEVAIRVSNMFKATLVDEIHFMRKIVIDGSNTTGFQRTAIIGVDGTFEFEGKRVGIQTICLEEDAARLIEKGEGYSKYDLTRLGVPLLEIATEPLELTPQQARRLAESLGRSLKLTGFFSRGLGTIRQDVNVSMQGGGIVEVKGVQKLEQIEKVVEFEEKRQSWLFKLAEILKERGVKDDDFNAISPIDVSDIFKKYTESEIVKKFFKGGALALKAPGFRGLIGYEEVEGTRLGLDLADICKLFGFKGIIHSDEISKYGFEKSLISELESSLNVSESDGYVLVFGDKERAYECLQMVKERLKMALKGPVSETRYATEKGTTRYLRPRPGASRMYPETDIPTIAITEDIKERFSMAPIVWENAVKEFSQKYGLDKGLAEQILDSNYLDFFELAVDHLKAPPSLVASLIAQVFTQYENQDRPINEGEFLKLITMYVEGKIAKEAVIDLAVYMVENSKTLEEAIKEKKIEKLSLEELRKIIEEKIDEVLSSNLDKSKIYGAVMGRVMSVVRGKVDGKIVNEEVKKALEKRLGKTEG